MPRYLRLGDGEARCCDDRFTTVADDESVPEGDVIVSLARFQAEGEALLAHGRAVGVRLSSDQSVEGLVYDLPRIAVIALEFPKFRDGRPYTQARLLRERYGYTREVRAVGDVLREQAAFMLRCGFDAAEPADGSTPDQWTAATRRFRHVYQRSADGRQPIYEERAHARSGGESAV
jgi:uncharacterized protein (DUF934 family)